MARVRELLVDFNPWWKEPFRVEGYRDREAYESLGPFLRQSQIVALTGLRRPGKTPTLQRRPRGAPRRGQDHNPPSDRRGRDHRGPGSEGRPVLLLRRVPRGPASRDPPRVRGRGGQGCPQRAVPRAPRRDPEGRGLGGPVEGPVR